MTCFRFLHSDSSSPSPPSNDSNVTSYFAALSASHGHHRRRKAPGWVLAHRKTAKRGKYKYTPIIIVTSRDKEEDKRRGIQTGANAYIVKGNFDQSNLRNTVQNLIE